MYSPENWLGSLYDGNPGVKRLSLLLAFIGIGFIPASITSVWSDPRQENVRASLRHEVTVTLKLVQVYVTDKRGNPITDLQKDDFVLYDNKQEKQITEFERHVLALPKTTERSVIEEPVKRVLSSPPPLLNRKFFLLFDLVFTEDKGFRIAREAALRFMEAALLPTDEASLLTFSGGRSLDVRRLLTPDHGAVSKSIQSLTVADLLDRVFPESEDLPVRIASSESASTSDFRPSSSGGPSETRILAGNFIWALKSFAQALRYVPGQKHVVLYSKGIKPTTIGRGPAGGTYSELSRGYADMCKDLAAAGVSVFPVNTQEPDTTIGKGEATLRETAAATGGRYLGFAVNAEKHMETINDMTGMYYVLGYPVGETWDGRFHFVRIKVSRPGCETHAQPGYFNPKPFSEYSKLEKEIHLVDLALSGKPLSQDPMRFTMQPLPVASTPKDNLIFVAEIPRDVVAGIVGPKVEAASLVFDALDEIVDSKRVRVDLSAIRLDRNRVFLSSSLSARPGTYKCRLVLRDANTGRAAIAGASVMIPEGGPDKLLIFPPLLALEPAATILSGMPLDGGEGDSSGAFLIGHVFLFDPRRYSPYIGDQLLLGDVLLTSVRCVAPSNDVSGLGISVRLSSQASGEEMNVPLSILEKRDGEGTRAFLARLEIPNVHPGLYKLIFVVNDSRSGFSSQVTRKFSIK